MGSLPEVGIVPGEIVLVHEVADVAVSIAQDLHLVGGRQGGVEVDMDEKKPADPFASPQQRDDDERSAVHPPQPDVEISRPGDGALRAHEALGRLGPRYHPDGDTAAVHDGDRRVVRGVAFHVEVADLVECVAAHAGDGLLDPVEGQHVVGLQVLGGALEAGEQVEENAAEHLLLAARADGDRLGLVADGVDGARQLVDGMPEGDVQKVDGRGVRALLAEVSPEVLQGELARHVLRQKRDVRHRAGVHQGEDAAVLALGELLREILKNPVQVAVEHPLVEGVVLVVLLDDGEAHLVAELAEKGGVVVDRRGGIVTPEMAGQRVEDHRQRHGRPRDGDHRIGDPVEAGLAFIGEDDDGGLVGLEDGHVLDDVARDRLGVAGGADEDQGLRGEIDVLLVLDEVRRDGLVAELARA